MQRTLIIGGTFNPVHTGHLRLAAEVRKSLGYDQEQWIPCHVPRHKCPKGLLSFSLRLALLRAAVEGEIGASVNDIEIRLPSPSSTYQTLQALTSIDPDTDRHFILGCDEFLRLHEWYRGRETISLANWVVAGRMGLDVDWFCKSVETAWPGCRPISPPEGSLAAYKFVSGRRAVLLRLPRLEISSSLVRERWLSGRNLEDLLPQTVLELLTAHRADANAAWAKDGRVLPEGHVA
jgi:nicotinate-nucleotide adenylyltransferase